MGLGQTDQIGGFSIYPDGNTALEAGYGNFFHSGNQIQMTGPYGPITVTNINTIYPDGNSALQAGYGNIFVSGTGFSLTGPKGAIAINPSSSTDSSVVTPRSNFPNIATGNPVATTGSSSALIVIIIVVAALALIFLIRRKKSSISRISIPAETSSLKITQKHKHR